MRIHLAVPAILALVLLPVRAADTTMDKSAPPSRIAGTWNVSYEDLALGEIDGTATVEPDGRQAKVVLRHPGTGKEFTLKSESIAEKGDDYTIVLIGESPSAEGLLPDEKTARQASDAMARGPASPPPANPSTSPKPVRNGATNAGPNPDVRVELPGAAEKIEVHIADFNGEVGLKPWRTVETNRVVLALHFGKFGVGGPYEGKAEDRLTGYWRFFADPVTWRDAVGRGRVGYFRRDPANPNYATQSAAEVWVRGTPPSQLQLFAIGVFNWKKIDRLYLGVPTIVEAIFEEPQDNDTCTVEVKVGDHTVKLTAHRDPDNWRRFLSEPFVPGADPRPAPAPTMRPVPPRPSDDDEPHAPFSP